MIKRLLFLILLISTYTIYAQNEPTTAIVIGGGVSTAEEVSVEDTAGYFDYESVEGALYEIGRDITVGGDGWGAQVVESDATLTGTGVVGNTLKVDTSIIATLNAVIDSIINSHINVDSFVFAGSNGAEWLKYKLSVDTNQHALSFHMEEDGVVLQIGQEFYIYARNASGEQIDNGDFVRFTGSTGEWPNVDFAGCGSYDSSLVIGCATHNILNGEFGFITFRGYVQGVDLSAPEHIAGTINYLGHRGGHVKSPPTYPDFAIIVGSDIKVGNNGKIFIYIERTTLNIPQGAVYFGDTNRSRAADSSNFNYNNDDNRLYVEEVLTDTINATTYTDGSNNYTLAELASGVGGGLSWIQTKDSIENDTLTRIHIYDTIYLGDNFYIIEDKNGTERTLFLEDYVNNRVLYIGDDVDGFSFGTTAVLPAMSFDIDESFNRFRFYSNGHGILFRDSTISAQNAGNDGQHIVIDDNLIVNGYGTATGFILSSGDTLKDIQVYNADSASVDINGFTYKWYTEKGGGSGGAMTAAAINDSLKFETSKTFTGTIQFDYKDNYYTAYAMSGNLNVAYSTTNAKTSATAELEIVADGTSTFSMPDEWHNLGNDFVNIDGVSNYIIAYKHGTHYSYNIYDTATNDADVIPPIVNSAEIGNYSNDIVSVQFSETVFATDTTGIRIYLNDTVQELSSLLGSGSSELRFTLKNDTAIQSDTLKLSILTGNNIEDASNNSLAQLLDTNITNNIVGSGFTEGSMTFGTYLANMTFSSDRLTATTTGWSSIGLADQTLTGDGYIVFDVDNTASTEGVICFRDNEANQAFPTGYDYYFQILNGATYRGYNGQATATALGHTAQVGDRYRLKRVSSVISIDYYRSGTWTELYEFPATSASTFYLQFAIYNDTRYLDNVQLAE